MCQKLGLSRRTTLRTPVSSLAQILTALCPLAAGTIKWLDEEFLLGEALVLPSGLYNATVLQHHQHWHGWQAESAAALRKQCLVAQKFGAPHRWHRQAAIAVAQPIVDRPFGFEAVHIAPGFLALFFFIKLEDVVPGREDRAAGCERELFPRLPDDALSRLPADRRCVVPAEETDEGDDDDGPSE